MTPFEITFDLPRERYDDVGLLKPSAALYVCQEAAGAHCRQHDLDWDNLQKKGLFWAVIRVRGEFYRMPCFGETIKAITWPMPTTRSAFPRTTEGYDVAGNCLFRVTNLWVLMDTEKRTMVLPAKSGVDLEGLILGRELPLPGSIHPEEFKNRETRVVSAEDIDRNGHMNNTRYMDWLAELMDGGLPIKGFTACYLNEALPGQKLTLSWEKNQENMALEILRQRESGQERTERIFAVRADF